MFFFYLGLRVGRKKKIELQKGGQGSPYLVFFCTRFFSSLPPNEVVESHQGGNDD